MAGNSETGGLRDYAIGFRIAVGKAVQPAMPKGGQLAVAGFAPTNDSSRGSTLFSRRIRNNPEEAS